VRSRRHANPAHPRGARWPAGEVAVTPCDRVLSRLNTNIGDTRGKIAILLEARRRFDVNCLLPQCFRSLEEKALL
jgi:hypothetical protein